MSMQFPLSQTHIVGTAAIAAGAVAIYALAKRTYLFKTKNQSFWGRFGFLDENEVQKEILNYNNYYHISEAPASSSDMESDTKTVPSLVDKFYSLVTDIYILGWGESFHFAPIAKGEPWEDAMIRHETNIGTHMKGISGKVLLDVGCGVGGPMRTIAKSDENVSIVGISINEYQVDTCNSYNMKSKSLSERCKAVRGNFLKMPFSKESFDGAYAVEATCHAPELELVYDEVFRVLKPGSFFVSYEWLTTSNFDETNATHVKLIQDVVTGNALPNMRSEKDVRAAAKKERDPDCLDDHGVLKNGPEWDFNGPSHAVQSC